MGFGSGGAFNGKAGGLSEAWRCCRVACGLGRDRSSFACRSAVITVDRVNDQDVLDAGQAV